MAEEFKGSEPTMMERQTTEMRATSQRKMIDCRRHPSVSGCTLSMAGTQEHLLEAAVQHMIAVHDEKDTPELRRMIQEDMRDVPENDCSLA